MTFARSSPHADAVSEVGRHSFETPGHVALSVEVPAGTVSVESWAEPRVEVEVAAAQGEERSARAAVETRVTIAERRRGHEVVVRAPKREGRFGITLGRVPELSVSIHCPEGTDLELTTQSADLDARGSLGDVSARSASGDVTVADTASLAVTTASGDLSAGVVGGSLSVKSASGDVSVRSVGAFATVNTVSGDVRLDGTAAAAAVRTVSGDIDLAAAMGSVMIGSVSGDVEVAAVPGLVLRLDAQSVSGTMTSELDLGDEPPSAAGDVVEIRARTVSGDVRIGRSTASSSVG